MIGILLVSVIVAIISCKVIAFITAVIIGDVKKERDYERSKRYL